MIHPDLKEEGWARASSRGHVRVRPGVMGTVASLRVMDRVEAGRIDEVAGELFFELESLEGIFSTYRSDSEVSRVNRGELDLLDCSPEVVDVLDAGTWLEHRSKGAFRMRDPAHPERIDPAGFVKGWAAERASAVLDRGGIRHWSLSVGGDVVVRGGRSGGTPWRVAVADPFDRGATVATLDLPDGAVATSGLVERGPHIWAEGPRGSGSPVSITVAGPYLAWADALATAAFAMGTGGPAWLEQFDDYGHVAVMASGDVITSLPERDGIALRR